MFKITARFHSFTSALFVPGNSEKYFTKCISVSPSVYIPDMEDSVPLSGKIKARSLIAYKISFIKRGNPKGQIFVRPNGLKTNLFYDDIDGVLNSENADLIDG